MADEIVERLAKLRLGDNGGVTPPEPKLSDLKQYVVDSEEFLKNNNIEVGDASILNPPKADNTMDGSSNCRVRTNLFKATTSAQKIYQHRVLITGHLTGRDGKEHEIRYCNTGVDEFHTNERRAACQTLFDAVVVLNSEYFGPRERLYYDLRYLLFSLDDLKERNFTFTREKLIETFGTTEEMKAAFVAPFHGATNFTATIEPTGAVEMDLKQLAARSRIDEQDSQLVRFLDIATSQEVIEDPENLVSFPNGLSYFIEPANYGYDMARFPEFSNGIYMAAGLQKASRLVVEDSRPGISLVVEPKLSLFHTPNQTLEKKLAQLVPQEDLSRQFDQMKDAMEKICKGLYVYPAHILNNPEKPPANPRLVVARVQSLTKPPREVTFEQDGVQTNVEAYFQDKYEIELKQPDLPAVVCRQGRNEYVYPMEVLIVMDNQRVANRHMTGDLTSSFIRASAVTPAVLQPRILDSFRSLNTANSEFLKEAGITLAETPTDVDAVILPPPTLGFGRGVTSKLDSVRGDWRAGSAILSANTVKWYCCVAMRGNCPPWQRFDEHKRDTFVKKYMEMCRSKGVNLDQPEVTEILDVGRYVDRTVDKLRHALEGAVEFGCKFVLVITNRADVPIHNCLKSYEQQLGIITQNVCADTAIAAAGLGRDAPKILTMQNIVHKTNVKLGGLNYDITVSDERHLGDDELFLGFAVNYPGGGRGELTEASPPTIIGYAANDLQEPIAFSGDFVYQKAIRQGDLKAFEFALDTVFGRYMRNRDGKPPKRVFVYRNGVSEGEMQYILKFEVPLIKKKIAEHLEGKSELVFLVVNKLHNVRLTPIDPKGKGAREQNIPQGVVVSRDITSPIFRDFYVAGHRAQQGTSKIPRYIVLYNEPNLSIQRLTRTTYALNFAHQIINSTTALPSPVHIAEEYAKRGRNIYNSAANAERVAKVPEFSALTGVLSYGVEGLEELREKRINA